ncbi:hypothetical protein BK120_23280 [Paenibacillus sp. FSL A5-0031]|uniref:hypothetical protein n=1 Tax=Paenibacillus sp. FSL A5-0031 TaxID=1920420 RepID=UPI00096FAE25|nr:hypothetical protein [Paenibacillus sp. FSL A5-0031]OME78664.1 hypothetical protein BK120_23280 [Paenibacillus sp. FSL A5-0031]
MKTETFKERAYVYLLYCVLLDIRSASYTHRIKWWNPASWVQAKNNVIEINNIADVFHNLPDLIVNRPDEFDEKWFWDYLRNRLPEKYEFYNKVFNEKINEIVRSTKHSC